MKIHSDILNKDFSCDSSEMKEVMATIFELEEKEKEKNKKEVPETEMEEKFDSMLISRIHDLIEEYYETSREIVNIEDSIADYEKEIESELARLGEIDSEIMEIYELLGGEIDDDDDDDDEERANYKHIQAILEEFEG